MSIQGQIVSAIRQRPRARARIGFLFNHEQLHQMPHMVPVLNALCALDGELDIHAFVTGQDRADILQRKLSPDALLRTSIHVLRPPLLAKFLDRASGRAVPFERIGTLFRHRATLAEMDLLVVPETTSTLLKSRMGLDHVKLVYTQHGAGDRAVGFKPVIRRFDHVMVPGSKVRDRMLAAGLVRPDGFSEIGYPKFDDIDLATRPRLFDNDNPVVLYNPHFHPGLSSWFRHGLNVLDHFLDHPDVNLILAPHVMLFGRRLHVSTDPWRLHWRRAIPARYHGQANILIDTGSTASVDMTYTRAADIYLGDVSSQIYEFIHQPKPCIFLNSHGTDWRNDANYAHWHLGEVIADLDRLPGLLASLDWHHDLYAARQIRAFEQTFGTSPYGGATRAAEAIRALAVAPAPLAHDGMVSCMNS